ncbi:MAG: methyltransferase domain-containing protein [Acidobacteriota bacterium]
MTPDAESRGRWIRWSSRNAERFADRPWALLGWETIEGVEWDGQKVSLLVTDFRRKLRIERGHTLLDVGCGSGWLTAALMPEGGRATGIDFAPDMVRVARRASPGPTYAVGNARDLPIADCSFDRALISFLLINEPDERAVFKIAGEAIRALRPGGICLVSQMPLRRQSARYDEEKARYLAWWEKRSTLGADRLGDERHPQVLHDEDFGARLGERAGCRVETVPAFNHFWRDGEPIDCSWRVDYVIHRP